MPSFLVLQGIQDNSEFAAELFDALVRRRNLDIENGIDIEQFKMFWEDIALQDSDTRLHIFFDM